MCHVHLRSPGIKAFTTQDTAGVVLLCGTQPKPKKRREHLWVLTVDVGTRHSNNPTIMKHMVIHYKSSQPFFMETANVELPSFYIARNLTDNSEDHIKLKYQDVSCHMTYCVL